MSNVSPMVMEELEQIRRVLSDALQQNERIAAVYLFGSFAQGTRSKESDLDVAILFREQMVPDPAALVELQYRLSEVVALPVDLVCLNQAPPVLAMQVLRKGETIVERSRRDIGRFYTRVVNEYDDLKRIRKPIEEHILDGRIYG